MADKKNSFDPLAISGIMIGGIVGGIYWKYKQYQTAQPEVVPSPISTTTSDDEQIYIAEQQRVADEAYAIEQQRVADERSAQIAAANAVDLANKQATAAAIETNRIAIADSAAIQAQVQLEQQAIKASLLLAADDMVQLIPNQRLVVNSAQIAADNAKSIAVADGYTPLLTIKMYAANSVLDREQKLLLLYETRVAANYARTNGTDYNIMIGLVNKANAAEAAYNQAVRQAESDQQRVDTAMGG